MSEKYKFVNYGETNKAKNCTYIFSKEEYAN